MCSVYCKMLPRDDSAATHSKASPIPKLQTAIAERRKDFHLKECVLCIQDPSPGNSASQIKHLQPHESHQFLLVSSQSPLP